MLACMAISSLFISCKDDNESKPASLEAKWELQQMGKLKEGGVEELTDFVNSSGCANNNFALLSDGSTRCLSFKRDADNKCVEGVVSGTWSKSGNTFTMVFPGPYQRVYEVMELTSSRLKIKFLEDEPKQQTADADNLWVYKKIK